MDGHARLQAVFEDAKLVDVAPAAMRQRMIKSAEEIEIIKQGARIGDLGGEAIRSAIREGMTEFEIALVGTEAMVREIGRTFPDSEIRGHLGVVPVRDQHRRRPQLGHHPEAAQAATSSRSTASR